MTAVQRRKSFDQHGGEVTRLVLGGLAQMADADRTVRSSAATAKACHRRFERSQAAFPYPGRAAARPAARKAACCSSGSRFVHEARRGRRDPMAAVSTVRAAEISFAVVAPQFVAECEGRPIEDGKSGPIQVPCQDVKRAYERRAFRQHAIATLVLTQDDNVQPFQRGGVDAPNRMRLRARNPAVLGRDSRTCASITTPHITAPRTPSLGLCESVSPFSCRPLKRSSEKPNSEST